MSDASSPRPPDPKLRPQPKRPALAVEPLRPREVVTRPSVAYRVALLMWGALALVVLALAAVAATEYDEVATALETMLARGSSGATDTDIADTAKVTLLGSAATAVLLLVVAGIGLSLSAARKSYAIIVLLVAGLGTIGASILFWSFMSDAASVAGGALRWGPLVCAGLAVIATVAASTIRRR
ncbi:hypothetical protein QMK17_18370 [Rhodococcus sp. G-MC3]|uniref:hypothetical protein n=1 Tax=Rhodococcus sp. G-MC3 TaxID=3046209 RepID=UPI0024BAF0BD|nr:hypothetical protein [Rhodococcus sp. G-MC3]MDJ0395296.1 hypothetical protein [Rhodococcus sp. G-MC3]